MKLQNEHNLATFIRNDVNHSVIQLSFTSPLWLTSQPLAQSMTAIDYSKNCCLFCPHLGTLQCRYTRKPFGYLPSLMAPSARHRSHFFPSSFSDMLNISFCQAISVKPSSGAAFNCRRKSQNYDLNADYYYNHYCQAIIIQNAEGFGSKTIL